MQLSFGGAHETFLKHVTLVGFLFIYRKSTWKMLVGSPKSLFWHFPSAQLRTYSVCILYCCLPSYSEKNFCNIPYKIFKWSGNSFLRQFISCCLAAWYSQSPLLFRRSLAAASTCPLLSLPGPGPGPGPGITQAIITVISVSDLHSDG